MFSEQREMGQQADNYSNNLDIAWGWLQIRTVAWKPEVHTKAATVWHGIQAIFEAEEGTPEYKANLGNTVKSSPEKQTQKQPKTTGEKKKT